QSGLAVIAARPTVGDVLYDLVHIGLAGAGIEQQGLLSAKQQIEERLLEIGASRLAKNIKVRIVFMNLKLCLRRAVWTAWSPASRQDAALHPSRVGLPRLRITRAQHQEQESDYPGRSEPSKLHTRRITCAVALLSNVKQFRRPEVRRGS